MRALVRRITAISASVTVTPLRNATSSGPACSFTAPARSRRRKIGVSADRGTRRREEQRGFPIERLEYLRLGVWRDGGVMCHIDFLEWCACRARGLICLLPEALRASVGVRLVGRPPGPDGAGAPSGAVRAVLFYGAVTAQEPVMNWPADSAPASALRNAPAVVGTIALGLSWTPAFVTMFSST